MNSEGKEQLKTLLQHAISEFNCSEWERAETACKEILDLHPDQPDTVYLLGLVYQNTARYELALQAYGKVLALGGRNTDVYNNIGTTHEAMGNVEQALENYRTAVRLNPAHFQANYNFGRSSRMAGDLRTAIKSLNAAVATEKDSVPALLELGVALKNAGEKSKALACVNHARAIQPENPVIANLIGNIHQQYGELTEAVRHYRSAITSRPDYAEAYNNLGSALLARGDVPAALSCYRKAASLYPHTTGAESNILMAENYLSDSQQHLYGLHKEWADSMRQPDRVLKKSIQPAGRQQTRIGYVSPDFRAHSVSWFMMAILQHYDRNRFHVTCFSDTSRPDHVTEYISSLTDHWVNITGQTTDNVAKLIRECNIDVLVDLAGHTANNRMDVFARRAAPIQVSYLGYPNTTGLCSMDYRITDNLADPVGEADTLHSEKLVRLPGCFLCYTPFNESPACTTAPVANNEFITFGSFNVLAKISDACIDVWCTVLHGVKDSKLLLKSAGLGDPETRDYISMRFRQNNIDPERIIMVARTDSLTTHLDLYSRVDIALDTIPYNGTTTTCEALWMGVPVITLACNRHAGRVGQTLLTTAGLEELVAATADDFVAIAARLASNRELLYRYRMTLRDILKNSPLCDGPGFTRTLEDAFLGMR